MRPTWLYTIIICLWSSARAAHLNVFLLKLKDEFLCKGYEKSAHFIILTFDLIAFKFNYTFKQRFCLSFNSKASKKFDGHKFKYGVRW